MVCLGWAPTKRSTSFPALKINSVGMPSILNRPAVCWFSSTFNLPMTYFPPDSLESCSSSGAIARQGGHHTAQKSTSTGRVSAMMVSKLASVTVTGWPFEAEDSAAATSSFWPHLPQTG